MASIYDKASLVLIPSGTKTSKVYSQKPTNGDGDFTFSRSTAATRVNASGNIEKETQNLLLQSNSFNTTWIHSGTVTSGQSGYDGTNDAWKFENPSITSSLYQSNTSSGVQTISAYFKKNATYGVRFFAFGSSNANTFFDLNNGVVVAQVNTIDASIEPVGTDWFRCSMTFNQTNTRCDFYVTNNALVQVLGEFTIQDAQLEQGLVARDYIETTTTAIYGGITDNVPRLDYTDSSCPALLLEPQRTNIVANGDYIESLSSRSGSIVTTNYGISPEGYQNSTRVQKNTSSDGYQYLSYLASPSTTYTMSIYAKGSGIIWFNFYDGTSAHIGPSENLTSEWVRYTFTTTTNSTTSNGDFGFKINNDAEVYGFQMEEGSYATSYIPTYGSAVTRNADSCSKTGISSLIGQTEGTFFAEFEHNGFNGPISQNAIYTRAAGSTSNYMYINVYNGRINVGLRVNSTTLFDTLQGPSPLSEGVHKCAFAYKSGDIVIYLDGQSIYVPSNNVYSNLSLAELGVGNNTTGGNQLGDGLKQVLVFKTRLSNEELATLTTI